jgi:hypothetical protein
MHWREPQQIDAFAASMPMALSPQPGDRSTGGRGATPPVSGSQRRLIARKRGERLGELAADRASADMADFRERGREFVLAYLRQYGATSGEVITDAMKMAGIRPQDDRAFGPIYAYLANEKRRQIVCVGLVPRVKGHGTAGGRVWALA